MDITKLQVQHLRTHDSVSFPVTARVTVITGRNGSGKTTLLEALHIALRGTSFRGSDRELLQHDADWWRVDVETTAGPRTIAFDEQKQTAKKKFLVDDRQFGRLPIAKKLPVVLFEPEDLRVIHGSPARRRQFFDAFISQVDPQYNTVLRKYERALKQRNAALKQPSITRDDVFVWDMALAEYGAHIIERRSMMCAQINESLTETYRSIADTNDEVSVHYSHTYIDGVQQKLVNELYAQFARDTILGFTSVGPHRHDILFRFNGQPALQVASRGEVRSTVLALKFIEVDITTETTGVSPIVLLDDVFAELDEIRQQRLAEKCRDSQMFITSTHAYTGIDTRSVISLD